MGGGKQSGSEQLRELPIASLVIIVDSSPGMRPDAITTRSPRCPPGQDQKEKVPKKKDRLGLWGGKGGRSTKHPKALGCS
jgi:hypothetical protein